MQLALHPTLPAEQAQRLDEALRLARTDQRQAEHRLATFLHALDAGRLYRELGFTSLCAYGLDALELTARQTLDLLAIGRSLPELPLLDEALASGELGWTKARELVRVATPETEAVWVAHAGEVTSRELERDVASSRRGELPPDGQDVPMAPAPVRVTLTMSETEARLLRDALSLLRSQTGLGADEVGDGMLLASMAQKVLHEGAQDSEAPCAKRFRIVVEHCPRCRGDAGVDAAVDDTEVSMASCDAEVLQLLPGPKQGHLKRAIRPSVRKVVLHRDGYRCVVPGCCNRLWFDVHHVRFRHQGRGNDAGNLATLCSAHHQLLLDWGWSATRVACGSRGRTGGPRWCGSGSGRGCAGR